MKKITVILTLLMVCTALTFNATLAQGDRSIEANLQPMPTSTVPPLGVQCQRIEHLVSGMIDRKQTASGPYLGTTCLPTAGASVLEYWGAHGYPNLTYAEERMSLISALDWHHSGPHVDCIACAFDQVIDANGYSFSVEDHPSATGDTYWDTIVQAIQNGQPPVMWILDAPGYHQHAMTVIGYYDWTPQACNDLRGVGYIFFDNTMGTPVNQKILIPAEDINAGYLLTLNP